MSRHGDRIAAGLIGSSVALVALILPAATGQAAPQQPALHNAAHKVPLSFGAKLTKNSDPSGAGTGISCKSDTGTAGQCTRVEVAALGRNDDVLAPKTGTLKSIKLVAAAKGKFRLLLAKAQPESHKAKVVAKGPEISYHGQSSASGPPYTIETVKVNMPIKKGDYLAIQAASTSMLQCSGGGLNQLLFQPPLAVGGHYEKTTHIDGCLLLLEGVY